MCVMMAAKPFTQFSAFFVKYKILFSTALLFNLQNIAMFSNFCSIQLRKGIRESGWHFIRDLISLRECYVQRLFCITDLLYWG